jgi:hypothetical protein
MPDLSFYCRSDEIYIKLKKLENRSDYITELISKDLGIPIDGAPIKRSQNDAVKKSENKVNVVKSPKKMAHEEIASLRPDISLGIPIRDDRPKCKACNMNLDNLRRCSQKKCKMFLKVQ